MLHVELTIPVAVGVHPSVTVTWSLGCTTLGSDDSSDSHGEGSVAVSKTLDATSGALPLLVNTTLPIAAGAPTGTGPSEIACWPTNEIAAAIPIQESESTLTGAVMEGV